MNRTIFQYLRKYTTDTILVNRLLVTTFLGVNNTNVEKNIFIKSYTIQKQEKDYIHYLNFKSYFKEGFSFEELIQLFEFVISPKDKIVNGAVYTPPTIRSFIIKNTCSEKPYDKEYRIADISCGCGGFLADAALYLKSTYNISFFDIYKNNIHGLDIKSYSIERTKILLSLLSISNGEDQEEFQFNLHVGNALNFEWEAKFDVIVGNPPYVTSRNIDDESKKYLDKWEVCSTGHPDLYIPFFQIGIENLKEKGRLGFITMNSFFKSINGRALRNYFERESFELKIIDFGNHQVFPSKSTYTCICLIKKDESSSLQYKLVKTGKLNSLDSFENISYASLDAQEGWNLQNQDWVKKIESVGKPFSELFKTRNGIATLKNKIYIFSPEGESQDYYYLNDGKIHEIEKSICKDIINPNKLIDIDNIESIKQKVIFPYYYENDSVKLYAEEVLESKFPKAYNYLTTKKEILATRDKGNRNYENWYAYGRNQSLEKNSFKLFFPHITYKTPNFVLSNDEDLLFHNGLAVVSEDKSMLLYLKKLFSTKLFWSYITQTSKPYGSGYYSLSRNYIKNFGVHVPSKMELEYITKEDDQQKVESFFNKIYGI